MSVQTLTNETLRIMISALLSRILRVRQTLRSRYGNTRCLLRCAEMLTHRVYPAALLTKRLYARTLAPIPKLNREAHCPRPLLVSVLTCHISTRDACTRQTRILIYFRLNGQSRCCRSVLPKQTVRHRARGPRSSDTSCSRHDCNPVASENQ